MGVWERDKDWEDSGKEEWCGEKMLGFYNREEPTGVKCDLL